MYGQSLLCHHNIYELQVLNWSSFLGTVGININMNDIYSQIGSNMHSRF